MDIFVADTWMLRIPCVSCSHQYPKRCTLTLIVGPKNLLSIHIQHSDVWTPLWKDYRSVMENCFLWQVMYKILVTNHWRFPLAGQAQPKTWCSSCTKGSLEDVTHCFWSYFEFQEVWDWVQILVQRAISSQSSYVMLTAPRSCQESAYHATTRFQIIGGISSEWLQCCKSRRSDAVDVWVKSYRQPTSFSQKLGTDSNFTCMRQ